MSTMALTCMAGCIALVISAAKSATTHLLTWWTVPITALVNEDVCMGDMHKGGLTFCPTCSAAKERERKREEERGRERKREREREREGEREREREEGEKERDVPSSDTGACHTASCADTWPHTGSWSCRSPTSPSCHTDTVSQPSGCTAGGDKHKDGTPNTRGSQQQGGLIVVRHLTWSSALMNQVVL